MTRIDLDGEDPASGLAALVLTVVDLLVEVLEREAVRRMESDQLSDEEIERLGTALAEIEAEINRLVAAYGVEEEVTSLRNDLDGLVSRAVRDVSSAEGIDHDGEEAPSSRRPVDGGDTDD